jgi:hypothetical protein
MDFSSQTTYTGNFTVSIDGYVKENCEIVAFLQDNDTKEVLQAQKFDLEDIVGIGENPLKKTVSIYPNPASTMLHVKAIDGMTGVRIMNHLGQLVLNRNTQATNFTLNVSKLQSGIYFVEITTNEGSLTEKILIK